MKILIFSPYQYISVHSLPEALVAKEMEFDGCEIHQVGCDGLYADYCISMSAMGVMPLDDQTAKMAACEKCKHNRNAVSKRFRFSSSQIDKYMQPSDFDLFERILAEIKIDNWADYDFDGLQLGRYAAYEFLLTYKINNLKLSQEQWLAYQQYLKGAIKTYIAGKRMLDFLRPNRVLVYNNFYSANHIICILARKLGVPSFSLHAGSHHVNRLSEITIFRGHQSQFQINESLAWKEYARLPLTMAGARVAHSHIDELLNARSMWVYSISSRGISSRSLRDFFGIKKHQKVLLALMASGDERFSANLVGGLPRADKMVFKSQVHWIRFLIRWAADNPNIFLVIRVHPRDFPNKRDNVKSLQASQLAREFESLPINVKINWPSDEVSLHDLIKIVDVGLNSTSTAGIELLMFGTPVVIIDDGQLYSYPPELNITAESKEDYLQKINAAVESGWSTRFIYGVYKWIAFKSEVVAINIEDGFAIPSPTLLNRVIGKAKRGFKISQSLVGLRVPKGRLKNHHWITYAIKHNKETHMEDRVAELKIQRSISDSEEVKAQSFIMSASKRIWKKIGRRDLEFQSKIKALSS